MAKRGFTGALMRVTQARDHVTTVVSKERITPNFMRVHLRSDTLFDEVELVPTAWLRAWFPDHTGKDLEHQRAYTISSGDLATGEFSFDFVLHEPVGPAAAWALNCEPGDSLSVMTLGSSKFELPEERPAGYLLIGDSAGIPGFAGIIGALPHEVPIELYLEQHDPNDRLIPIPSHPLLRTHWVPRTGPDSLAGAIEARDWSNWHAWVTPESASLKQLRTRLRDEFGFPKSETHAQAYWVEGRAMGKLRDGAESRSGAHPASISATEATAPLAMTTDAPSSLTSQADDQNQTLTPTPTKASASSDASSSQPSSPAPGAQSSKGEWRAAAGSRLLAPLKPVFWIAGILQTVVTLIELAPFFLLVELSRRLLAGSFASEAAGGATDDLWVLGLWAVALIGLGALFGAALLLWLHAVDANFERGLRRRLIEKLGRLPLGWFDVRGSSQVKRVVQDDTLALHYLVTHAVPDAVAAIVAPIAVLAYLFAVDWRLALLMFLPVLVYAFTMYIMILRSYDTTPKALRWAERMSTESDAYLEAQPIIRVFGGAAASTFRSRLKEYIGFLDEWQRPFTGLKTFMDLATRPSTFLLLICVFGTLWITGGSMDPLALLPFLLLGTTFGSRLLGIGYGLSGLRDGLTAAKRLQQVLEEQELTTAAETAGAIAEPPTSTGHVSFDHVSFAYRGSAPAIDDVSLELFPGTVTALVGPSGSGKSTLAALLARFHDVGSGAIRIDGEDLRTLTADELYARVGFVFQQTQLVRGTVRENIALAAPEASDEQVEAAARAANIHERILRLPRGYDTEIGTHAALSGGEKQRLTIARAILADTPVLVLDEATAFADPESEFLVQQAIGRLTEGRTVLVIAHRLHTVVGVDRIVVLERGRIAESGTHDQLLAHRGRYRELWEAAAPPASVDAALKAARTEDAR